MAEKNEQTAVKTAAEALALGVENIDNDCGTVLDFATDVMEALADQKINLDEFSKICASLSGKADTACDYALGSRLPGNKEMHPKIFEEASATRQLASDLRGYVVQIAIAKEGK